MTCCSHPSSASWHGCPHRAREPLPSLTWTADPEGSTGKIIKKLDAKLNAFIKYLDANQFVIVNYGDRYRHCEPITTEFVQSAVRQQWSPAIATNDPQEKAAA